MILTPAISSNYKAVRSFLKTISFVSFFILLELTLIFLFRKENGFDLNQYGGSFNKYLLKNGDSQFLLGTYSSKIVVYTIVGYFWMVITFASKERKEAQFFTQLNQSSLKVSTVIFNLVSFFVVAFLMFAVKDPQQLLNHPTSWQALLFTLSPIFWGVYLYSICDALFSFKLFLKLTVINWKTFIFVIVTELIIFCLLYTSPSPRDS